ncbi:M12 family metallopeptidase [Oligoflexaceae bacterium]|nr:M12 family metallopeptidase [Oligoflexaceae bacterium]
MKNFKVSRGVLITAAMVIIGYIAISQFDFGHAPRQLDMAPEVFSRAEKRLTDRNAKAFSQKLKKTDQDVKVYSDRSDSGVYEVASHALLARNVGGRWIASGDILVDESSLKPGFEDGTVAIAEVNEVKLWPNGEVPVEINVVGKVRRVKKALAVMQKFTSLRFPEYSGQSDYISFEESTEEVCQSFLGRKGGRQEIILHSTCTAGQIMHEIMHALGYVHEHSRADRDQYIKVHFDNILIHRKNQFQKLAEDISVKGEFDFYSLLLYPPTAFSRNNRSTITKLNGEAYKSNREYLSKGDIAKIESIYGVLQ